MAGCTRTIRRTSAPTCSAISSGTGGSACTERAGATRAAPPAAVLLPGAAGLESPRDLPIQAPARLGRRVQLLPPLDRALARPHRRSGGVRDVPGRRGALPGDPAREVRRGGAPDRARRARERRGGGGVPHALVRARARMADRALPPQDRKSTRLNSSHMSI